MFVPRILTLCSWALVAISGIKAQDYCSESLCPSRTHIACGHSGNFAASCPSDAVMLDLTPFINTIVFAHNMRRNRIAGGCMTGYRAATRMATMQWDSELAKLAALNVRQCKMEHDKCRNTAKYKMSGQNLAYMWYTGPRNSNSDVDLIKKLIQAWWDEYKIANMNYINKYPENYSGPDIGHFTVFVADRNNRVGCGATRYTIGQQNHFLLACNYATTNILGESMYTAGKAASACTTGKDSTFKNLCSTSEVYNNA